MKKRWIFLILIFSATISFACYTFLTIGTGILALDTLDTSANRNIYYLYKFLTVVNTIFMFVFGTVVTSLAFIYLSSKVLKRWIKRSIRIIINCSLVFLLLLLYGCRVYTTPMVGEPYPYNDIYNFFATSYSIVVIIGCIVSGFSVLYLHSIGFALRNQNVQSI